MALVWQAQLTDEMVADLSADSLQQLIEQLDDAVMAIASDWDVK